MISLKLIETISEGKIIIDGYLLIRLASTEIQNRGQFGLKILTLNMQLCL